MDKLITVPIHRALHRPNLILGGERELVLFTAILCAGVAVSGLNLVSAAIGAAMWLITLGFLQMMAKADPYMSRVYLRHIRYLRYYPARSRPACEA
jgi:type IV secretion system protein TrbD